LERRYCRTGYGAHPVSGLPGVGHDVLDGGIRFAVPHQESNETRRDPRYGQIGKADDTHRCVQRIVHGARGRADIVLGVRVRQPRLVDTQLARHRLPGPEVRVTLSRPYQRTGTEAQFRGVHGQVFRLVVGGPHVERLDLVR